MNVGVIVCPTCLCVCVCARARACARVCPPTARISARLPACNHTRTAGKLLPFPLQSRKRRPGAAAVGGGEEGVAVTMEGNGHGSGTGLQRLVHASLGPAPACACLEC